MIYDPSLKQCCTCKEWIDRENGFRKTKASPDGLNPRCKKCTKVATGKWYQKNKEYAKSASREYKEAHPEYDRKYREENRERIQEYSQQYHRREGAREKARFLAKMWLKNNPERNAASSRNWRENNPDKARETSRRYYKKNPDSYIIKAAKRKALMQGNYADLTTAEWKEVLEFYNYTCLCCGKLASELPGGKLTQDHIVPLSKGGAHTKSNIQPLCFSCNVKKGVQTIDYRSQASVSGIGNA